MSETKDKKIELAISTDKNMVNSIMKAQGDKKAAKYEREVFFNKHRYEIAREFIWQIKRIHHWWNNSGDEGSENQPLEVQIK